MSMPDEDPFTDLIAGIIAKRREQGLPLNPDWIAFEAVKEMDPGRVSHPAIYEGAHLYCRHMAAGILGGADIGVWAEPDIEPKYTEQLRAAAQALSEHADALAKRQSERKPNELTKNNSVCRRDAGDALRGERL